MVVLSPGESPGDRFMLLFVHPNKKNRQPDWAVYLSVTYRRGQRYREWL